MAMLNAVQNLTYKKTRN